MIERGSYVLGARWLYAVAIALIACVIGSALPPIARAGWGMASAHVGGACLDQAGPQRVADEAADTAASTDDDDDADHGDAAWALPRALSGDGPQLCVTRVEIVARTTTYCSIVAEPVTPPPRA
jgi:hypothetical protein